jgi:hypothetical protein
VFDPAHITTAEVALAVSGVAGAGSIYNAITGRGMAHWQRARDAERREARITVAFEHSGFYAEVPPNPVPPQPPSGYRLRIIVVNSSETSTVWIRRVVVEEAKGDLGMDTSIASDGPVKLQPGEPVTEDVFPDRWDLNFADGIIVKVHLVPDDWQESAVEFLLPELMGEATNVPERIESPPRLTSTMDQGTRSPR